MLGLAGLHSCCHVHAATSNTQHLACQVSRKELERVQKHKGRLQELLLRVDSLKQVSRQGFSHLHAAQAGQAACAAGTSVSQACRAC